MPKKTSTAVDRPSVTAALAQRYGMDVANFEVTLQETILPQGGRNVSRAHVAAFLLVAHEYELNPFTKEIYAFPGKGGGVVPMVSIDGWIRIVNRNETYDGVEFHYETNEDGKPVSCTCRIFRKDLAHPVTVTEYLEEVRQSTGPWKELETMRPPSRSASERNALARLLP